MILKTVEFSLRQRVLVITGSLILAGVGIWSAIRLPIDAVPDITSPQVLVITPVSTLAPEEIEKLVTYPLESAMAGLPDMKEIRSLSKFGLSQVRMTFEDGIDLYRTRQMISERIREISEILPSDLQPRLAPVSTALGEIFYYTVDYTPDASNRPSTRHEQLFELKQIQEYVISPMLRATPGVAEINSSGGFERQIVVKPDLDRLAGVGMTLTDLSQVISANTQNVGGGMIEVGGEQIIIRANTRVNSIPEIQELPIKFLGSAKPLIVKDVAKVENGSDFRTGTSTVNGEEAVVGGALMLAGANSRIVARDVAKKIEHIQEKLPAGILIRPLYNRSELVDRTLETVEKNLFEGALLVVVVLFALLGNFRAALIVALAIPLSMLFAVTGMVQSRVSGNLMSLGAIDFGLIIDGAVVMVENIVRRIAQKNHQMGRALTGNERLNEVIDSAKEVANPMFFGVLIITVVYLPILALTGIEGKMFHPMALTVIFALAGSLVLSVTLMPVLCSLILKGKIREKDNWLVSFFKSVYTPLLDWALNFRWVVIGLALCLIAGSALVFTKLGAEFIPKLKEGTMLVHFIRSSSVGLEASVDLQKKSEKLLLEKYPEIKHVFSFIGTAEIAIDPMGSNLSDTFVELKPKDQWRIESGRRVTYEELIKMMRRDIQLYCPGQAILFTQPIEMRFNEMMAGVRADLAVKIYGDDFAELEDLATKVRDLLREIPGSGDVEFDAFGRSPLIEIKPDREALGRYNLRSDQLNSAIQTALAGEDSGIIIEGNRHFHIVVRLDEEERKDMDLMKMIPVQSGAGGVLTLGQVAQFEIKDQVAAITRESGQRRAAVLVNLRGRDVEGFVKIAHARIKSEIEMPAGYYFEFGGQYENLVRARNRLAVIVPLALLLIFVLLVMSFGNVRQAILVFVCVPLAMTGGIFSLWARGMPFTISAAVGFIALSGIAVLNGIMLVSFINQLRKEGRNVRDAVVEGTLTRLRPKLMTALVASFGFVPMALSTGAGAEVQQPLATVVIGGIITSTFLTLVVLPVLYEWIERNRSGE